MKIRRKKRHLRRDAYKLMAVMVLGVALFTSLLIIGLNRWKVVFTINGRRNETIAPGSVYEDPGAVAYLKGTTLFFSRKELEIITEGIVDTDKAGTYTITYTVNDDDYKQSLTRTVTVRDTKGPQLTLIYDNGAYTEYNTPYEEEGYYCYDDKDGDLTDQVVTQEKDGKIYYSVTDADGNVARAERIIYYDDRTPPVITLSGGEEINITNGSVFRDEYTADDDVDGDISALVSVSGTVDTSVNGDYTLTYSVSDTHANTSTVTRLVHVIDRPLNNSTGVEGPYVIYLTFDDGPYKYTEDLLAILDKYDVKATFFTTSAYPAYAYCLRLEYEAGHTVAVHTATHEYSVIYASEEAYWADFDKQNAVVEEQTGTKSTLFRFPGGSSNTVSCQYSSGIMTRLAEEAAMYGYTYFDWNVTSGDAGDTTDTDTVYKNVINGITANTKYGKPSVVLMHDVKDYSVAAVESIILWGFDNGYEFRALDERSYMSHQTIVN